MARNRGGGQPGEVGPTIPLQSKEATVNQPKDKSGVGVNVKIARRPGTECHDHSGNLSNVVIQQKAMQ